MHPSTLAKRVYLFIFIIAIAFYLYGLGKLPLLGPDEPRYAQVAREMFLSGDFITPTLGGHTWFEKPSLLYWLIAASFKMFGVSDWSARFGPALCGLLTIVAVWCVGREVDRADERSGFGFWSLVVMASCLGLIVFSRAVSFDVVITMTTTWALAFFLLHELPTTKRKWMLLAGFYTFVGLSLLAKGLVGVVIPFGVVGFYYALRVIAEFVSRQGGKAQRKDAKEVPDPPLRSFLCAFAPLREKRSLLLSLLWGIPLALAVSAIWYGPVIARHGWSFVDEFFVQHHFARYVSNKYHHPQPLYFYPAIILMLALPWTPYLVIALAKLRSWAWRADDSLNIVRVFSFAWLFMPIIFFSFSGSKLPGYVLPALPAVALLVADRLTVVRNAKWPLATAGATAVLVVIVLHFAAPFANRESVRDLLVLADAHGYAGAPVLAQGSDDRSAEFYAYDRVVYKPNGEPLTFDEITVSQARARAGKFVVMIPLEHAEKFRGTPGIEIIGDNGKTAVLGWKLSGN